MEFNLQISICRRSPKGVSFMDAQKHESAICSTQMNEFKCENNKKTGQAMSQVEAAFSRGLAGLREYLNQLTPDEKSKLIQAISTNIERY
jgi:hypothetical protein